MFRLLLEALYVESACVDCVCVAYFDEYVDLIGFDLSCTLMFACFEMVELFFVRVWKVRLEAEGAKFCAECVFLGDARCDMISNSLTLRCRVIRVLS